MAKIKDFEKPEGMAAGRLTETFGVCKYCQNSVMIKADPDATDEEKDRIASLECSCKEGRVEREVETAVRTLTDKINMRYDLMPEAARKALIASLKPVAKSMIEKATFKINENVSIQIFKASDGLNIKKTIKEDEIIGE